MLTDIIAKDLKVLFCGINPGLKSASDGHHFSGRSNRFWKVLHQAGFTPQQIEPENDFIILELGYGLTTAVARPTTRADELSKEEFSDSIQIFKSKINQFQPQYIAFLGKAAYKAFSGKKQILWGLQEEEFCGSKVWVLPNPSGLNRGFMLDDLVSHYTELYLVIANQV
ncbi:G/U mismatch-specific uracil-DNA glycosylase [Flavobacterium sp. 90]|uniref:G/U mismatch-specific DNA glycosylase n=1 Tax=unclassified Flavobacterium TaxID=196869 RepID=UPI000EB0AB80|nr:MULTISPECIES: G/U mismatch-specific DNA glycosylase [unclassified Flavobacterium]RKR05765.1 G/U mismatch-specific uracil-DNA glycosylase [Flavobacterium sp. 81]TCK57075.1 G/U mismatch-specific uracil-DNA glycosylase [Flavobacterium sp. 90]